MHVCVLGSVALIDGKHGDVLVGAGPRQRSLLAALVLAGHHCLSSDLLIDWMWGEDLPAAPRNALSLHASRLRATLARVFGGDRLRHEGGCYRLELDGVRVDLDVWRAGREQATARARQGRPEAALAEAGAALQWWTGRPLAGLPDTPSVRSRAAALEEEHLAGQCERAEFALAADQGATVIADLADLVRAHPLDERLRRLQMRALHGAGRTAEALMAFASARTTLIRELGVGPGTQLERAYREVLARPARPAATEQPPPRAQPAAPAQPATPAQEPVTWSSWGARRAGGARTLLYRRVTPGPTVTRTYPAAG